MSDTTTPTAAVPNAPPWDEDVVFAVLGEPIRAAMLCAIARQGRMTAAQLQPLGPPHVESTVKHLFRMRAAGLVVATKIEGSNRRIYSLAPAIVIRTTPSGKIIDFGFCFLRL